MILDRGMIKWLPFRSLPEQEEVLKRHGKERENVDRPILSSDQLEYLDRLVKVLVKGTPIRVTIFKDGFTETIDTLFQKISYGTISTSHGLLSPADVIDIEVLSY